MGPVPVYILAGGKSSRFGSDKARAPFGDSTLIQHVAQALAATGPVTVVADVAGKYADLGLRTIADRTPGCGPMSGLDAALADLRDGPWLLLVSCDLAGVRPDWPGLLAAGSSGPAKDSRRLAVAFRGTCWEPLCALYHQDTRSEVARRLAARELSMQRLLDAVGAASIALPPDWAQANTPAELAEIRKAREE